MFSSFSLLGFVSVGLLLAGDALACCGLPLCVANRCPKKRAFFGDLGQNGDLLPRQADPYSTIYPLSTIPPWAALPYSSCGATSSGTKTICPLEWYCHCHSGTKSLCLPTATTGVASVTTCSPYSGTTSCSDCEFYWATTLTQMATAYQQCGGFKDGAITEAWDKQTLCPVNYRCNPLNFWYEQCIPATLTSPPLNPMQYWACASASYSYPTSQGNRCGGHCYRANGMQDGFCPSNMKCWTKTLNANPGYDAYCYSTSPSGNVWATNLCYPIPYEWPGYGGPTCTPQTAATQTPWGQCYGSTNNAAGTKIAWNGPSACQCAYSCTTYNPSYGICASIPNFPQANCGTAGGGTQTLYGRCGGSTYVNGSAVTWTSPTLCQAGATCVTDQGGWYAQCTSLAKNRRRVASPVAAPAALPYANAAPEPTASVPYVRRDYENAKPASRPKFDSI